MKYLAVAVIYMAFFSLLGFTCYVTKTSWPLLGLLLTPKWEAKRD